MAPRNDPPFRQTELTGCDLLDYVATLVFGVLFWVAESYSNTPSLVFDPAWTAVGLATGLVLFAASTFSPVGRQVQLAFRERPPIFYATFFVGFLLVIWLMPEIGVTVRPAHYSWFLGLGLSQLPGIALYLRQRASG